MPETATLGTAYARAFAAKSFAQAAELMHPEIDFRALTPNRTWEADNPEAVVSQVLEQWLEGPDEVTLEQIENDTLADRERVGYRLAVHNPEGDFLVEQQAYLAERDGRISWMRVVCSGFRPAGVPE